MEKWEEVIKITEPSAAELYHAVCTYVLLTLKKHGIL